ncbi:MAG: hypothetical protein NZV14_01335 [Bryobacteraceae bacterium]|nr:hypothetical protein [Bryobacteraceae bacterium]MDW8376772.1 hypothetical protein [Bryobacterales bacterium]
MHLVPQYDPNFSPAGPGNINAKHVDQRLAIPETNIIAFRLGKTFGHHCGHTALRTTWSRRGGSQFRCDHERRHTPQLAIRREADLVKATPV